MLPTGRGTVNRKGLDFYRRLVSGLQERNISSIATLYHWDLAQTLQDRGGWENRDSASWFADYAAILFDRVDGVDAWLTVNEAKIVAQQGYQRGWMAPGKIDPAAAGRVIHHLGLAHGEAVRAFRASDQAGSIGPCLQLSPCYPYDESDQARRFTEIADVWQNTLYLDPILNGRYPDLVDELDPGVVRGLRAAERAGDLATISAPVDFVGLNYYSPTYVDQFGQPQVKHAQSSAGWQQIYPTGLYDVLTRLHTEYGGVEVKVVENGLPDEPGETPPGDQTRTSFLIGHLLTVHAALEQGVNVSAYCAWSLLDNFEWARGYTQRWGLVEVDFDTQERITKDSASWYADVISRRGIAR